MNSGFLQFAAKCNYVKIEQNLLYAYTSRNDPCLTGPKKSKKAKKATEADGEMSTDENDVDDDDDVNHDVEMSIDDVLDDSLFEIPENFVEDPSR